MVWSVDYASEIFYFTINYSLRFVGLKHQHMNLKKTTTRFIALIGILGLLSFTSVSAQQAEHSEEDIAQYVAINKETLPIQLKAQEKMMTALKESGMDMQKFQTMMMSAQQGDQTYGGASEEDITTFKELAAAVNEIQTELGTQMQAAVQKSGMEPIKFQQMTMTYQQDAEFRAQIDEMMGMGDGGADMADEDEE